MPEENRINYPFRIINQKNFKIEKGKITKKKTLIKRKYDLFKAFDFSNITFKVENIKTSLEKTSHSFSYAAIMVRHIAVIRRYKIRYF